MKRFRSLFGTLLVGLTMVGIACSAGEGDSSGNGADGDKTTDGDAPVDPETGVPTGTLTDDTPVDSTPSNFEDYTSSCDEQVCTEEETCQTTRTGSDCMRACPGQPCPPSEQTLISWCDRQGGVECFPE